MDGLERLCAVEEIKRLKAAYFRCMDLRQWDEFEALFTADAIFDVRGALELPKPDDLYEEPVITGARAIRDYVCAGLSPLVSVHHGHMPEIDILSATEAAGLWPMSDMLIAPPGAPFRVFRGYGHYRESYAKSDGRWRIATLRLRRLHVETE